MPWKNQCYPTHLKHNPDHPDNISAPPTLTKTRFGTEATRNPYLKCACHDSGTSSGKDHCCVHNTCSPRAGARSAAVSSGPRRNARSNNPGLRRRRSPARGRFPTGRTARRSRIPSAPRPNPAPGRKVRTVCCFLASLSREELSAPEFGGSSGSWRRFHRRRGRRQRMRSREGRCQFVLEWSDRGGWRKASDLRRAGGRGDNSACAVWERLRPLTHENWGDSRVEPTSNACVNVMATAERAAAAETSPAPLPGQSSSAAAINKPTPNPSKQPHE